MAIKYGTNSVTSIVYGSSTVKKVISYTSGVTSTNNVVWEKPYTFTLKNQTSGTVTVKRNTTNEPSATTGTLGVVSALSTQSYSVYYEDYIVCSPSVSSYIVDGNASLRPNYTVTANHTMTISCCFLPDAQVLVDLEGGTQDIAEIKSGDTVITYNKITGKLQETECFEVYTRIVTEIAKINFTDNSFLILTTDHVVYDSELNDYCVDGIAHTALPLSTNLLTKDGTKTVESIEILQLAEPTTTYDISVLQGSTIIVDDIVCISALDNNMQDINFININSENMQKAFLRSVGDTAQPNACNWRCSTSSSGSSCLTCSSSARLVLCDNNCSSSNQSTLCLYCSGSTSGSCANCSSSTEIQTCTTPCSASLLSTSCFNCTGSTDSSGC